MLVAPVDHDGDIPALISRGFCMRGSIRLESMEENNCHGNTANLWKNRNQELIGIATGYALAKDGLWRQHSWGVLINGILETTVENVEYFGILMQGEQAEYFVYLNS